MLHIGRNIFSLVFSRVISGIILFLIYIQLYQYLGTERTGQFGLLAAYLTVFSFFVDLGMSQLVIKKISEDKEHAEKYLNNFFGIQVLLGLGFTLLMGLMVFLADYPTEIKNALYVTSLALLASSLSMPFRAVIISFQKLTLNAWVNFFNALVNGSMMVLAIWLNLGLVFLSTIVLAVGIMNILVYGWIVHRNYARFSPRFDSAFAKQLFIWNIPFMLLTFFSIYNRIDGLLLPHLRNFTENGYYSAAYRIWDTLAFVPGVVGITLYPFFADALNRNAMDEVKKGLETYTRYMVAVAVPMSVGAFMLSKPLTLALFKGEFLPAAPAVWLLVVAVSILFVYTPANSLIISKLTKTATKITGLNLLFNLTANLVFIPIYGFVAAAVITVASELIQTIGYTIAIKTKIVSFRFFRSFIKPLLAAAAMAVAIYFLEDTNLWLVIAVAVVVYSVALLLIRFFDRQDLEIIKAAVNVRKQLNPEQKP